ncbi:MAG: recombinase family protein [Candidatus Bathyarchaeia archaeon]
MSNEGKIVAAIYARTSSSNQKYNYSIEGQVSECWDYCKKRGWLVRYVFIDECQCGGTVERPKFQLMLEKAKKGEINVVIFWKLDRFCRSLVDLINTERMLRNWGVGLCSATEFLDTTTPVGRFNFRNIASFSELERELIGERARLGLHALARELKWPNPQPPLAYDRANDGRLVINIEEAKLVRKIFTLYLKERSMAQVAYQLNAEGIKTKKGKDWTARAVRDVLTNELYIGCYRVAGVYQHVKEYAILEKELFDKAQQTMLRFSRGNGKRPLMPLNRKAAKVEKILHNFREIIGIIGVQDSRVSGKCKAKFL